MEPTAVLSNSALLTIRDWVAEYNILAIIRNVRITATPLTKSSTVAYPEPVVLDISFTFILADTVIPGTVTASDRRASLNNILNGNPLRLTMQWVDPANTGAIVQQSMEATSYWFTFTGNQYEAAMYCSTA